MDWECFCDVLLVLLIFEGFKSGFNNFLIDLFAGGRQIIF